MSSRFAGKGACACSSDQVSNIRLWPSPHRNIGATEGRIITRSQQVGTPAFGIGDVIAKVSQAAFGSALVTNVLRGQVAEAIVALALEPEWNWCSADYSGWDFERPDGLRLEVKQSAARQSWSTGKPSKPIFDVAARTGHWESGTQWIAQVGRPAHIYIFAHHGIYADHADHRDPAQWAFYVVATRDLPDLKQAALSTISRFTTPVPVTALADKVRVTASQITNEGGV
ncbi:hypothetical protein [Caenibius sp. WL]|uniref:hypothetical protein n=1 Tax=Caenibius sp. WL TaxID=2872646 RepID=UPI001C99D2AD|nr:hypothetical protein [Caenibius sp. WL]QZP07220.1 hypothetical protein K5X80_10985 [Caenibius sp. WL]